MKTKTNKTTNHIVTTLSQPRIISKRKGLLQSYFSNALVLAALLESAHQQREQRYL